jgi:6-phosphogluconolactonase/glucosamine-6-phosphate isomerase/deaminase
MLFFKRRPRGPEIWDFSNATDLCRSGAAFIREMLLLRMRSNGGVSLCLSASPPVLRICELLPEAPRQGALLWERLHLFWAWERAGQDDDAAAFSAFELTRRALLSRVQWPEENIHPIPLAQDPETARQEYAQALGAFFGSGPRETPPAWDMVVLEVDERGGLAGLPLTYGTGPEAEPGADGEAPPFLTSGYAACPGARLALPLDMFAGAHNVLVVAMGAAAQPVVAAARAGGEALEAYPAGRFKPQGRLVWLTEQQGG